MTAHDIMAHMINPRPNPAALTTRTQRTAWLLVELQARPSLAIVDATDRMRLSERGLYRILADLRLVGVPVVRENGRIWIER